ncbi:DUF805 domain-containing protein (plasmid) [Brucella pituitosa]|uniref:DUF805 domain-containing protein n=1 Tax=Brucella pituitosa TaxID=571256 RepID=UPI003C77C148
MNSYLKAFKHYFDFSTRTSRQDFWLYMLFAIIVNVITTIIDAIVFDVNAQDYGPLFTIASIVQFIPTISISTRRLHDIDKSGWWQLIIFIPIIGIIALIVFYCKASQQGYNRFGQPPYGESQYNPATPAVNAAQFSNTTPLDELEKLNKLKQSGAISDEEFAVMKSKLLSSHQ